MAWPDRNIMLLFRIIFLHYLCIDKKGLSYILRRRISGITRTEHYGMGSFILCILTMFVLACLRRCVILMNVQVWMEGLSINLSFYM